MWVKSFQMPVQELRIGQNSNRTLPVCHPLETARGWETPSAFQPMSPKPSSPLGPGLWHPTSPVIPNRGSLPGFSLLLCFFNHLPAEGWLVLEQILERLRLYPVFFPLSVPSVRRLDCSCRQLKSRLPWPKVRIAAPVPCLPPVDLHSTHRARRPSAAFPETPTCFCGGMLSPFLLPHAHPLPPTHPPILCPPVRAVWLSLKARESGGEGESTGCQPWFTFSNTPCSDLSAHLPQHSSALLGGALLTTSLWWLLRDVWIR